MIGDGFNRLLIKGLLPIYLANLTHSVTSISFIIDNLSLITYVCDRSSFKVLQTIRTELSN